MFKIEDEYDLHTKVVSYIKQFYKKYIYINCLMVATLGENQDTSDGRITSWRKGYQKWSPDLIIINLHKIYKLFSIKL